MLAHQIGRGHINRGIWEAGWLWFRKELGAWPTYMLTIIVFPGVRVLSATYTSPPRTVCFCVPVQSQRYSKLAAKFFDMGFCAFCVIHTQQNNLRGRIMFM